MKENRYTEYRLLLVELLAGVDTGIEESKEKLKSFARKYAARPEMLWYIYRVNDKSDIHTAMCMLKE
jgi:hypothetical protein